MTRKTNEKLEKNGYYLKFCFMFKIQYKHTECELEIFYTVLLLESKFKTLKIFCQ